MNFYEDIVNELKAFFRLINPNVKFKNIIPPLPANLTNDLQVDYSTRYLKHNASFLITRLLEFQTRHISCQKRQVYISNELQTKLADTSYHEFALVVSDIKKDLENGVDVNGRLSKKIDAVGKKKYYDIMLYEWGLYHFHLGKDRDSTDSKYYKRSGELLIAYIPSLENIAYLVDISEDHYQDDTVFSRSKYLKIIDDNWPNVLAKYETRGIPLSYSLTDEQRHALRSHGVTAFNEVNGKIIMNPGLGITCAKTGLLQTFQTNYLMRLIAKKERVCRGIQKKYVPKQIPEYLNYKLKFDRKDFLFYIVEYMPQKPPKIIDKIKLDY